ncbi:hypothetical protein HHK36_026702 [Tetracentron sinense]|uniref:BTB domain-containing protein n=1 Tax=Tetracentron sinense TaxID=13715 RepID=A0A835D2V8_TETSI|nr:hypothetical protein HHK36_026702 [Tetracentron sinense]
MEQQNRREQQTLSERKGQKRKLKEEFDEVQEISLTSPEARHTLLHEVSAQVKILNTTFSWREADRAAATRATHILAELAKNEEVVNVIVDCGAVPVLVKHLQPPPPSIECANGPKPLEYEVEKGSAFALGLLAVKPEHQQLIVDAGALSHLVHLLWRHKVGSSSRAVNSVIRRAADAVTNLAHENSSIKTRVRLEGGIPPLVDLLEFTDTKIVQCNALPTLILMLQFEDSAIHYEAVGVIGNLVHSSPHIKREVILAGALQPVIGLLSSCCSESQREAALLLGQFAATDSDCKVHIVQRGAVRPLIEMLQSSDVQLREMSAFALGRLAQDTHNQAGIAHNGGLVPLLKLLDSKNESLQHNAAFALYGLADNEDNVSDFIKVGGVQKLQDGEFIVQVRLSVLIYFNSLLLCLGPFLMLFAGLELLLGLLGSTSVKQQQDGSVALYKLANKATSLSPVDAAPPSPTPQVYLGELYVNNATLSDVTFLVEGKRFCAHRICLLASSDAFRAMFDGGYREKDARDIEIPNIRWEVFELMMRFIYTGSVDVTLDIARDLLRAADQYLLEGLKRPCEYAIAQEVASELLPLLRVYKDGGVERFDSPFVPPSPKDPKTGVSSKDILISPESGVSDRLYLPKLTENQQKLPILVYFHGGGFCIESAFSSQDHNYLNILVSQSNVIAVSVEYRKAPEHPLPTAYDDCYNALQWVSSHSRGGAAGCEPWLTNHADLNRVFLGGDSAGANIVHNVAMRAGAHGLLYNSKILGAFLIESGSLFILYRAVVTMINPVGPEAPSLAMLGCSRVLVCVAGKDILRDRDRLYCDALRKSGWEGEVELYEVEGEDHCYHIFNLASENSALMIKRLALFLNQ